MVRAIFILTFIIVLNSCNNQPKKSSTKNEDRIAVAKTEKLNIVEEVLTKNNLKVDQLNILFVAFKDLDRLDVYAKNQQDSTYRLIKNYPICKRSGTLGPKKAEGDKQTPEGFYHIDRFNPKSLYYLSLGINYPNELDKALGYTGSDIFIHGKCETVGCLPMTDDLIKEIYLYALFAKEAGQEQIPVYIFPFDMTSENMLKYQSKTDEKTFDYWKNLQEGYDLFLKSKKELKFTTKEKKYHFSS